MSLFQKYNANPKNKRVGDCVVRAISTAINEPWDTVFMDLCEVGFDLKSMPNDKDTYSEYLNRKGFSNITIKVTKGSKRPTVQSFAQDNPNGTFVLSVANHLVTVVDGKYYDTWDSGSCCLYRYWHR